MVYRYQTHVDANMPNNAHGIALQLIGRGKRVLELGAAGGHVTRALVERENSVYAVEVDPLAESDLRAITPDVLITNLDSLDLLSKLGDQRFDVILAGDVLEHTLQGPVILTQLRQLLKPDGFLVISLPNIAHGDVRLALLSGEFRYRDVGLLDRTHRVFYTRETACELLELCGFTDLEVFASTTPIGTTEVRPDFSLIPKTIIEFVQGDPDSTVYQYIIRCRINAELPDLSLNGSPMDFEMEDTDPGVLSRIQALTNHNDSLYTMNRELLAKNHDLVEQAQRLESEKQVLEGQIQQVHADELRIAREMIELEVRDRYLGVLAELGQSRACLKEREQDLAKQRTQTRELEAKCSELADELRTVSTELGEETQRLAREMTRAFQAEKRALKFQREVNHLILTRDQLNEVYTSWTWKIGRFVMLPVRAIRRIFR
jgi:2-polyprenyl-3-methyl-5-hydroxy-6-metoxy-1,4-benzoquinol methylase